MYHSLHHGAPWCVGLPQPAPWCTLVCWCTTTCTMLYIGVSVYHSLHCGVCWCTTSCTMVYVGMLVYHSLHCGACWYVGVPQLAPCCTLEFCNCSHIRPPPCHNKYLGHQMSQELRFSKLIILLLLLLPDLTESPIPVCFAFWDGRALIVGHGFVQYRDNVAPDGR